MVVVEVVVVMVVVVVHGTPFEQWGSGAFVPHKAQLFLLYISFVSPLC